MSDKPDLVFDEPTATGPLRAEFFGDAEAGKEYLGAARKQLGAMRSHYGVNERIANGEPGGFFRDLRVQPDGTQIETLTNDGQDTVRVTVPKVETPSSDTWIGEGESTQFEGTPTSYEFTPEGGSESEQSSAVLSGYHPYLWIGARIIDGDKDERGEFINRIHLCVFEAKAEGEPEEVLSNRAHLVGINNDPSWYPLGPVPNTIPQDDKLGFGYLDSGLVQISRSQPDGYNIPMICPEDEGLPDPPTWDEMVIGDPYGELGLIDKNGDLLTCSADGAYLVKIMVKGDDCDPAKACKIELRVVTGRWEGMPGDLVTDDTHEITISEFTQYRMGILPYGWFGPGREITDDSCKECGQPAPDFGANPHGKHWWQGAATIVVPPLQLDVPQELLAVGAMAFTDEVALPNAGFEPGGYLSRADRCPACVTVYTWYRSFSWLAQQGVDLSDIPACPLGFGVPWVATYARGWNSCENGQLYPYEYANLVSIYGLPTATTARHISGYTLERHIRNHEGQDRYEQTAWEQTHLPGQCNFGVYFYGQDLDVDIRPPYDHQENFGARCKWSRAFDKKGNAIPGSEKASWISEAEYQSVEYPLDEHGNPNRTPIFDPPANGGGGWADKVQATCGRVERD